MAQLPSIEEQLAKVQKELETEERRWHAAGLGEVGNNWHMGNMQFAFRCEVLTIIELLKEKFGLSQDALDLRFKRIVLEQMRALYPVYEQALSEARRAAIVNGVRPVPPQRPDLQ